MPVAHCIFTGNELDLTTNYGNQVPHGAGGVNRDV